MQGPIFLVGSMRSGSTLLRLILDRHPRIAVGPETGFMGALAAVKEVPGWRHGAEWFTRIGWTEQEVDERLRDLFTEMFERYAHQQGKERWGEKTPFHTMHMAEMATLFPDSRFLGLIRHPAGAVASLHNNFHYPVAQAAEYWQETNSFMTRQGAALGDRFTVCRYEDLVAETEQVTKSIMHWLGEDWSPDLLQHHTVQRERNAPRLSDGGTVAHDRVDSRR